MFRKTENVSYRYICLFEIKLYSEDIHKRNVQYFIFVPDVIQFCSTNVTGIIKLHS